MMEASSLNDVFSLAPRRHSNKALKHSGYVKLANAVLKQAWKDARKNTLKNDSKKAREWLMERSVLLELWCSVAGVSCTQVMAKAKVEFDH